VHASTRLIKDRRIRSKLPAGVVADSLTGIQMGWQVPLCCQQELHSQGFLGVPIGKNPEDSVLASVEAMQWVLLYLSVGNDRCY
jgi:hypothetical protein